MRAYRGEPIVSGSLSRTLGRPLSILYPAPKIHRRRKFQVVNTKKNDIILTGL